MMCFSTHQAENTNYNKVKQFFNLSTALIIVMKQFYENLLKSFNAVFHVMQNSCYDGSETTT